MIHMLKCWPQFFDRIWHNEKNFEVRYNDREYQSGDKLILCEYEPTKQLFSGRKIEADVSYVLHGGDWGIESGTVVMGLKNIIITTP